MVTSVWGLAFRSMAPSGRATTSAPAGRAQPRVLARGPWPIERVQAEWAEEHFQPSPGCSQAADAAIASLKQRGSPSHDGLSGRLAGYREDADGIVLELQPVRWALRLVSGDASRSLAALCVARSADGRWLAGRRAAWLATWAGRWSLGAGGAVDAFENPGETLARELREEWSVTPQHIRGEALVELPHGLVMFVGQAWLAADARVLPDAEHDSYAWWPSDIDSWPREAEEGVRRMAHLLEG